MCIRAVQGIADARGVWVYAVIAGLWGTLLIESWKRKQTELALEWGMVNFTKRVMENQIMCLNALLVLN